MRKTRPLVLVTILVAFALSLLFTYSRSHAQNGGGNFKRVQKAVPQEYIVVLKEGVERSKVASVAQDLARAHGGDIKFLYQSVLKGFTVRLPEPAAIALSKNPQVAFVEENSVGEVNGCQVAQQDPANTTFSGLDRIDQRDGTNDTYCWDTTGAGVHAYILDTGIWVTHDEFQGRASVFYDSFGGDGIDRHNHGTAVAGVIGGATKGVAKNVQLHSVKVCDDTGLNCPASNIIAALDMVVNYGSRPAVVNMSLGGPVNTALDQAVRNTMAAGVLCVSAAGNDNGTDAANVSPARVVEGLTIAATVRSDVRASYSNTGSVVDLFAPGGQSSLGEFIPVPGSGQHCGGCNNANEGFTGTSAAAPHATGVAALYLEANPTASAYVVGGELKKNATFNKVITNSGPATTDNLLYSAFNKSVQHLAGTAPFYRYWNPSIVDHYYTTDWNELGSGLNGWQFWQVECYVHTQQQPGTVPLYMYWNPTIGDHYYTTDFNELGSGRSGWTFYRISAYVYPQQQSGTVPLYMYWNAQQGSHFFTINYDELEGGRDGWVLYRTACYVSP
jgi:subtilisin family serine protease